MMNRVLRNRPQTFPTLERAIRWCVEGRATRNLRSARVSMPAQIVPINVEQKHASYSTVNSPLLFHII